MNSTNQLFAFEWDAAAEVWVHSDGPSGYAGARALLLPGTFVQFDRETWWRTVRCQVEPQKKSLFGPVPDPSEKDGEWSVSLPTIVIRDLAALARLKDVGVKFDGLPAHVARLEAMELVSRLQSSAPQLPSDWLKEQLADVLSAPVANELRSLHEHAENFFELAEFDGETQYDNELAGLVSVSAEEGRPGLLRCSHPSADGRRIAVFAKREGRLIGFAISDRDRFVVRTAFGLAPDTVAVRPADSLDISRTALQECNNHQPSEPSLCDAGPRSEVLRRLALFWLEGRSEYRARAALQTLVDCAATAQERLVAHAMLEQLSLQDLALEDDYLIGVGSLALACHEQDAEHRRFQEQLALIDDLVANAWQEAQAEVEAEVVEAQAQPTEVEAEVVEAQAQPAQDIDQDIDRVLPEPMFAGV